MARQEDLVKIDFMGKVIGYMVTFTTYGTYLQGNKRGFVKNGKTLGESKGLREANKKAQTDKRFVLGAKEREIVRKAILDEASILKQEVYALTAAATHVHIVVGTNNELIETTVARYKRAATKALREIGLKEKVWTRGYDKRFCFDEKTLKARIEYVKRQKPPAELGANR